MAGRGAGGAAATTGSCVDVSAAAAATAATHVWHRGRCAWRAHLRAGVHRRTADAAGIRLRDMRRHRGPRRRCGGEAGSFMPAGHRLRRAGEGAVRAVYMRDPPLLGGSGTANVGETLLPGYTWRDACACPTFGDACACPTFGDGRARLRSAKA